MNEQVQSFEWLTGAVGTGVGAVVTYVARHLFDRRKLKAEEDSSQLDADTKAVELYERFASQLNPKIESLQSKQDELITKVAELKYENAELKIENVHLKAENAKLTTEIEELHSQFEILKSKIHE